MLTKSQADVILKALEVATESNWPNTRDRLVVEAGYTPRQIIEAWQALEKLAGCKGTAPTVKDF